MTAEAAPKWDCRPGPEGDWLCAGEGQLPPSTAGQEGGQTGTAARKPAPEQDQQTPPPVPVTPAPASSVDDVTAAEPTKPGVPVTPAEAAVPGQEAAVKQSDPVSPPAEEPAPEPVLTEAEPDKPQAAETETTDGKTEAAITLEAESFTHQQDVADVPVDDAGKAKAEPAPMPDEESPTDAAVTSSVTAEPEKESAESPSDTADARPAADEAQVSETETGEADLVEMEPAPEPEKRAEESVDTRESPEEITVAVTLKKDIDRDLNWESCNLTGTPVLLTFDAVSEEQTILESDAADFYVNEESGDLSGSVTARRGNRLVEADKAHYDHVKETLDLEGNIYFEEPGLRMTATEAHIDLGARQGVLDNVEYRVIEHSGRGTASSAHIESADLSRYKKINYTTCAPGRKDWLLEAGELEVDQETGTGTARNAKLGLGGVPMFYLPYISFPIDDRRKSGFLVPTLGVDDRSGWNVATPYYINIAPDMDATVTPRYFSKRGFMLGGEYRYLTEKHSGEVRGEVIPDDSEVPDADSSTRGAFSYQGRGTPADRWGWETNINYVSDNQYLGDFGNNISLTSTRNIERRGDVTYTGQDWDLLGRLQYYQTVDETISSELRPYSRMPQLLFSLDKPDQAFGLTYDMRAEYVNFNHSDSSVVKGQRVDLRPGVSLPMLRPWGFLIPKASLRYTTYSLEEQTAGLSDSPDRTVGTFSMDGGLVFDRQSNWLGQDSTHTLEPRLFYLYTPEVDQDDLPAFDTSVNDFSFTSLFRENRFSGVDRVGDANQLSIALTSRTFTNDRGTELFRGSIGQIYYFRDREVRLVPGESPLTDSSSPVVGELAARLGRDWRTTAGLQWNPHADGKNIEKGSASVHYRDPRNRVLNLSYRFTRNLADRSEAIVDQTDLSGRWPLSSDLHVVARWIYSFEHEETTTAFAGFEYDSCCWRVRFVAQQLLTNIEEDPRTSFFVQLELKGLAKIGHGVDRYLEENIIGYTTD